MKKNNSTFVLIMTLFVGFFAAFTPPIPLPGGPGPSVAATNSSTPL